MTQTIARIKQAGKLFEIMVDLDGALKFKKGETDFIEAEGDKIFTDSKKGFVASNADLEECFKTTDTSEIVKNRDEKKEKKFKQVVEFLVVNATDPQTGNPHTAERIKSALEQANVNIKNEPVENQINDIIAEISKIIPIKIETKKVKLTIPAIHTGQAYGVINQYKEDEKWLDNGDLEVIVNVPSGIIIDFYEKLNSITHGSALTEEIKE